MALTTTEESQTRQLIAQNAALLSLAASEPTIISKLAATKVSLAGLAAATSLNDADLFLVRQGAVEKSVAKSLLVTVVPDATETVKGIVELATVAEAQDGTDTVRAVTPAGLNASVAGALLTVRAKQIQNISAIATSNTMVVSLNPTSLDFRSANLTSGAINTRTLSAISNITIPQGATLGVANGNLTRIGIGGIDNAGTIEPVVVGSVSTIGMTETTLVNTTAISNAANSSNVIYSTTARTNVPIRWLGFADSNQTTAGTYASQPLQVQGAGGQAFTALSSIGYGQTWQDLTGSRVVGTTYYNTTGKPISLYVVSSVSAWGITINGVSLVPGGTYSGQVVVAMLIPPNNSYLLSSGTIGKWLELR